MTRSAEELTEDRLKNYLESGGVKVIRKTESMNSSIDDALKNAPSKSGGKGINYPDIKFFAQTGENLIPVMVEVKGKKGCLEKLTNNKIDISKAAWVQKFAANGAIHYANAIVQYTDYEQVIAVGANGYYENGKFKTEFVAYLIDKNNFSVPQKLDIELSALLPNNSEQLKQAILNALLTEEEKVEELNKVTNLIENGLCEVNQIMHDTLQISVTDRIRLICALIIVAKGYHEENDVIYPLCVQELKSENSEDGHDGKIVLSKFSSIIKKSCCGSYVENQKVINSIEQVLLHSNLHFPVNGESKIKTLFIKLYKTIIPFINNIDVISPIFNIILSYVDVPDGEKNDVVITPKTTTNLMVKLANIDHNNTILDPTCGTGAFFTPTYHAMKKSIDLIKDESKRQEALQHLKYSAIHGIELRSDIWQLCIMASMLLGINSANIREGNCLKTDIPEQVDTILSNPPYSVPGKGFSLLEPIMSKIKSGKAIILIQESAGSGQGGEYTKSILKHSSLIASIKMPSDLFIGKAGVQTSIFIFQMGVPHNPENLVKFIDFSNDGYVRSNRKKASREINLRDDGTATERSEELFALIYNRKRKTNHLDVVEDTITLNGDDWTFGQHKKINTNADINDFFTITSNYIDSSVKNKFVDVNVDFDVINKLEESFIDQGLEFKSFKVEDVFELIATNKLSYKANDYKIKTTTADLPATTCSNQNQMLTCYVPRKGATILKNCISVTANGDATCYYQPSEFTVLQDSYAIKSKINCSENSYLYFVSVLQKLLKSKYSWTNKSGWNKVKEELIMLPAINGEISFDYMEKHIEKLKQKYVEELKQAYNEKLKIISEMFING